MSESLSFGGAGGFPLGHLPSEEAGGGDLRGGEEGGEAVATEGFLRGGGRITGITSAGKSALLYQIASGIARIEGSGMLVINSRGDLSEPLLANLPPERAGDVIRVRCGPDTPIPPGLNPLAPLEWMPPHRQVGLVLQSLERLGHQGYIPFGPRCRQLPSNAALALLEANAHLRERDGDPALFGLEHLTLRAFFEPRRKVGPLPVEVPKVALEPPFRSRVCELLRGRSAALGRRGDPHASEVARVIEYWERFDRENEPERELRLAAPVSELIDHLLWAPLCGVDHGGRDHPALDPLEAVRASRIVVLDESPVRASGRAVRGQMVFVRDLVAGMFAAAAERCYEEATAGDERSRPPFAVVIDASPGIVAGLDLMRLGEVPLTPVWIAYDHDRGLPTDTLLYLETLPTHACFQTIEGEPLPRWRCRLHQATSGGVFARKRGAEEAGGRTFPLNQAALLDTWAMPEQQERR